MSDKKRIAQRFSRACNYKKHALVQAEICQKLVRKIDRSRENGCILEIGAGDGTLTRLLAQQVMGNHIVINELCPAKRPVLEKIMPEGEILIGDAEQFSFTGTFDLIISANTVQWFEKPLLFPINMAKKLTTNGQLIFNTFLAPHFQEIRHLTGQGLDYPTQESWEAVLKQYFSKIESEIFSKTIYFPHPRDVLEHLRQTGVTAAGEWRWTRQKLNTFYENYPQTEKGYPLTYCALLLSGHKAV